MITQVEVFTPRVSASPLPVTDGTPATDPIQIRNIEGLGPVNASVNTEQFGSIDGAFYNGSSIGKRNIVMTIGLNPNWANQSMEGLRQLLYAYFMPKNEVKLRFTTTHMATVEISGYVESFEPNMFSKDPEIQVSIICPQPAFVASEVSAITGVTLALPDGTPTNITYQGTLPTGFQLFVIDTGPSADLNGELRFALGPAATPELFIVTAQVDATKYLWISTQQRDKYVRQMTIPGGVLTSIMGKQAAGSSWMQLQEGDNAFRVMSAAPGQYWSLQYFAKYGGI